MRVDVRVETTVSDSPRARGFEAMFDVPRATTSQREWHGDLPLEDRSWNVGLIVGPSGSGKSTIMRDLWGEPPALTWDGAAVVDDFPSGMSMEEIAAVCQAVGFNTIPAWLRPHGVLSNGEQFRVELARRLLETPPHKPIVVDEFTSVVDRQVAQIGSHAVQKWARRHGRQFVAVTCHYDVIDWLQPDWVFEPATMRFEWRSVQARPSLDVTVSPVPHTAWRLFAPYHYLTAELHRGARCFCLFVDDAPVAFAGVLHRPHPRAKNIKGISRVVTLPDWQGLGLAFVLMDTIGSLYRATGYRTRMYPAHPPLVRAMDRSPVWSLKQLPGWETRKGAYRTGSISRGPVGARRTGPKSTGVSHGTVGHSHGPNSTIATKGWAHGARPCAVFEYAGPAADSEEARRVLSYFSSPQGTTR